MPTEITLASTDEWDRPRCQRIGTYVDVDEDYQCALVAGHDGDCDPLPDIPEEPKAAAAERALGEHPKPVRVEGMNGTGICKGDKIMADYSVRINGEESLRTIVMRVNSAWHMGQPNRTYVSGMDADGNGPVYVVHTDSIRIIA